MWPDVYSNVCVAPRGTLGCPGGVRVLRVNAPHTHPAGAVSGFRVGRTGPVGASSSCRLDWARVLVLTSEAGREFWGVLLATRGAEQGGGSPGDSEDPESGALTPF